MPPKKHNKHKKGASSTPRSLPDQCSTLLDDEMTRCSETPSHGNPIERCRVHHEQYQIMTGRYKEAQRFVDATLEGKALLMKKYVNAIRVERTGRELHHKRFFLKVDDGHKIRINVLAKQMSEGVEIRDALEARAMALYVKDDPAQDWMHEFQATSLDDEDSGPNPITSYMRQSENKWKEKAAVNAEDDLIALKLRFRRDVYFQMLGLFLDPDRFWPEYDRFTNQPPRPNNDETRKIGKIINIAFAQYFRRIVFHDPHLFAKSLGKISFKDLVMDDDFGFEDVQRIMLMMEKRMTFGLIWWKDSLTEAIFIKDTTEASANMGSLENRVKILGGWVYNNSRTTPAPNKTLLTCEEKQKDIENRYVRLCCNYDELQLFLTMSAFVMEEGPSFCTVGSEENPSWDSTATRKHLTLCGVIVTDMVNGAVGFQKYDFTGPMPSQIPAKQRGCITWVELERRTYIFGAIRNEPDDFTTAFLNELRARPDLFSVVTRSDTDPPRKVASFGEVTDQVRKRQFEAPLQPMHNRPAGRGNWEVLRTADNVLYGGGEAPFNKMAGYLSANFNNDKGRGTRSFFFHKRFPVKYFLIMTASPGVNVHKLARQVSWAAFRAHGLVQGDYDEQKYDKASDVLFIKHARERLSFLPEGGYAVRTTL
ncbi:hypothetical protein B0H11DRAFT_2234218 [Mycena galericulata]|nr:hypothetical protein B0H11DRAFT_2234218 [Mycena galericulata]